MTEHGEENQIIVVGGGAAGMMAAICAAGKGGKVLLAERNEKMGRKLYITGKGRCNVTNACSREDFLKAIPHNGKFLYSAVSRFSPEDAMRFFEGLGVPLKVERGNRVFPCSDKAADIIDALFFRMQRLGVTLCRDRVTGLAVKDGVLRGVYTETGKLLRGGCVILATGGASYPRTGSTGDGYRLAEQAGHTVTEIRGSLVPLESDDPVCSELQGLSLRNVELQIRDEAGKTAYREQGELLFTHFGISGPLVLSGSAHLDFTRKRYTAHIDLKPALNEQKLDSRLLRDLEERGSQNFSTILRGLVPQSMVSAVIKRTDIPADQKGCDIRRDQRRRLLGVLKDFTVALKGARPVEEAVVTSGGIKINEVDPKTMQSKKLQGLYFAGEILDVDGYTGGFNLQIAWSTGYVAGISAAERSHEEEGETE